MQRPTGKLWQDTFLARKTTDRFPNRDLKGKVVIFTGGTDGMGRVSVDRFAEMGADICLFGRNLEKTQAVVEDLKAKRYNGRFSILECDLGSLDQVRRAADEVLSRYGQINYLINCAGINVAERQLSPDGYEMNFAVNYLGPFLLTELLLERIKMSDSARIVQLVSATQEVAGLNFDDLQQEKKWSMLSSYAQAKLCMIMHGRDVAKRIESSEVSIICLNPGYISTNITRHAKGIERIISTLLSRFAAPTWVGGERIVAAALDPKFRENSGSFIYEDMLLDPNPLALDDDNVAKLMDISRHLAGEIEAEDAHE